MSITVAESAAKRRLKRQNAKKKEAFLAALSRGASVTEAIRQAGASREVYVWAEKDPEFAAAWDAAIEEGTDRLEDVALRRAVVGHQRNVYHQGMVVGQEQEVSDTLLIFLLKARRPEKFRERYDMTNSDGSLRAFAEAMQSLERDATIPEHATPAQSASRTH